MQKLSNQDIYWCVRRLPKEVVNLMQQHKRSLVVAGGYIRSCVSGDSVNDIDLFTTSKELAGTIASGLAIMFKGQPAIETENAYTVLGGPLPVQVIHRWTFETPEAVVPSFDFTIAKAAFWIDKTNEQRHPMFDSCCDDGFYSDLAAKRLVYCSPVRNEDAGGSLLRVLKFYQRGFRIPLDSLGAVIARLMSGVNEEKLPNNMPHEQAIAQVVTGLLREVDPSINPFNMAYIAQEVNAGEFAATGLETL